ncbi:MAG TPA: MFS transporter [Actinomycetes bacterium]|nr:MFS transporter [Actinomycetes bacterium]
MSADAHRLLAIQALRAFAYGLGSVLIGVSLARAGRSGAQVGLVLGALLAGTALVSLLLARHGDRVGRRRSYRLLLGAMGAAGTVFALTSWPPALIAAALTGTVSTEVVESGPFTSLEQAMLPHTVGPAGRTRLFGRYNVIATLAGAAGALAAGGPAVLGRWLPALPATQRWLLAYPVAAALGLLIAAWLSPAVEVDRDPAGPGPRTPPLHRSRRLVRRLAGLFALDSFGGGFVLQAFIAYWFARRFGASPQLLALVFFAVGLLQALSFQLAVRLAERIGLLPTMVFTHLPSNLLLAAVAFAPNLASALALLLARFVLSQMDVPTRQAYVVGVVDPGERTAAAAYTNTARYAVRPLAPLVAGALLRGAWLGGPFLVAGALKSAYDLGLYRLFRNIQPAAD